MGSRSGLIVPISSACLGQADMAGHARICMHGWCWTTPHSALIPCCGRQSVSPPPLSGGVKFKMLSFFVPWAILTPHLMSPFHQNQICRLTYFPVSGQDSDLYENKLAVTQAR